MNTAIVTMYTSECRPYATLSDVSKREYCKRHGFDYVRITENPLPDKHPVWGKVPVMLDALKIYDTVMWVDADACINKLDFDFTSLLSDKYIYLIKDIYGVNFGVFILRKSNEAVNFLNSILENYEAYKNSPCREQDAAKTLLDTYYAPYVDYVDYKVLNAYDPVYPHGCTNPFDDSCFILHLPDEGNLNKIKPNYRVDRFVEILKKNGLA